MLHPPHTHPQAPQSRGSRLEQRCSPARATAAASPAPRAEAAGGAGSLDCRHWREGCSGCSLATSLDAPPLLSEARAFFEAAPFFAPVSLTVGAMRGWRSRVRLAVSGTAAAVEFGLYKARSHELLPIPDCAAHHPAVNAALDCLRDALRRAGTAGFDERRRSGGLRYAQVCTVGCEADAAVEVVLVWPRPLDDPALALLSHEFGAAMHSAGRPLAALHAHCNASAGNAIVDAAGAWRLLHGAEGWHWETFGGAAVSFHPAAFLQANYCAFNSLLDRLEALLRPHAAAGGLAVCDLYAGCGPIGLSLLARGIARSLTAIDVSPAAAAPFAASAARLAAPARFLVASAGGEEALRLLRSSGAELVVVDPPRKGLDPGLLRELCSPAAPRPPRLLAYVSCGFAALKRDATALSRAGWRLAADPAAFLFFPGTDSLETLCVMERT